MIMKFALSALWSLVPVICIGQPAISLSKDTIQLPACLYGYINSDPAWIYNNTPETLSIDSIYFWCNFYPAYIHFSIEPWDKNIRDNSFELFEDTSIGISNAARFKIEPLDSVYLSFYSFSPYDEFNDMK
jgi:hypothetical protein